MNDTVYLIVPGYGNSDEHHWQSYFQRLLPNCYRIEQKSWEQPECSDWIASIHESVLQWSPDKVILVTHSLGGIALAHWANQYGVKIRGAFIVAPPDIENPYMDIPIQSFIPIPQTKLPFRSVVIGSRNDYWATIQRTQQFAESWGSELLFIGSAGHINSNSGHGDWEEGLELLKRFKSGMNENNDHSLV